MNSQPHYLDLVGQIQLLQLIYFCCHANLSVATDTNSLWLNSLGFAKKFTAIMLNRCVNELKYEEKQQVTNNYKDILYTFIESCLSRKHIFHPLIKNNVCLQKNVQTEKGFALSVFVGKVFYI